MKAKKKSTKAKQERADRVVVDADREEIILTTEGKPGAQCQAHLWPTQGLADRIREAAKDLLGFNVCTDCVKRTLWDEQSEKP